MSGYALTEHGAGDPQRLAKLSPSAQIAALASHANAPKTAAQATALIQQHIAAGTLIPLHGCANPCPRDCAGFGTIRAGCGGYVSKGK